MKTKEVSNTVGSAIVIGGGIGGMQAALDLADSGIKVYLVESESAIGGRMAQLDKTFPTNECAMCVISPKLVECARHLNIEILTNTAIEKIEGEAGNFEATLYKRARFVDMDKCTACDECVRVCPVETPSKFDSDMARHTAIYRMYPQAVPSTFVIDKLDRAPCVIACPAHINAQGYISLISQKKYKEAFDLIKQKVPFPGVLGRVCYHPCEAECNRKDIEEPIAINPLKRFVSDFVYKNRDIATENDKKIEEQIKSKNQFKVAVVGAGPCGLTAAYDLTILRYSVTIFEAENQLGGMMSLCIPSYRLPKDVLKIEIDEILKTGIEVKTSMVLGKDFTTQDLKKSGFNAILLATGAGKGKQLQIPGVTHNNVCQGVDFLKKVNRNEDLKLKGKKLLIIGGGNVAIDVARSALRLGVSASHIACLECTEEMPAHEWEIGLAEQEGVIIHPSCGPEEIVIENDNVKGVRFNSCLSVFDKTGSFNPVFDKTKQCIIEADFIVIAIGQQPDTSYLGAINVDKITYSTVQQGIFAAGDVATGPASVIEAIASGKEAAISIDRYLQNKDIKEGRGEKQNPAKTPDMEFTKQKRVNVPLLSKEERIANFAEVELTLSEEDAIYEAKRCLNCSICSECMECVKVCQPNAIIHDMKDERMKIKTGAVIATSGVGLFDAAVKKEYGYDRYDNVITSIQFERILSSSGPTSGEILRPSDGKVPQKIAFIQCVGSRDPSCGNEFCSAVCCMYSIKEAIIAKEHNKAIETTIFYIDIRSFGKDFERYYNTAKDAYGVKFTQCMVSKIYEKPKTGNLMVKYIDEAGKIKEEEFDLVVLAIGMTRTEKVKILANTLNIELNEYGFARTNRNRPNLSSEAGIFVAGTCIECKDIPETVTDGSSAAVLVSALLKDKRHTLVKKKEYPPQRDITDEDVRIGVFVCRCGRNIASVVDVPAVVDYASKLDGVAFSGEFLYTCSKDSLDEIKKIIAEHSLNRVVIASCTPRTHEELFRDTIRESGLNRYLFEMTSIREQVSWVHKDIPKEATEKSKELVSMMVAKTKLIYPLERQLSDVISKALVIGAGASGMQAALHIAKQGYDVYLIEKSDSLGGNLKELFYNPEQDEDPQVLLKSLIDEVINNKRIHIMTNSTIKALSGFLGNYHSIIQTTGKETEIEHGIVIVATGAKQYEPYKGEFGYGESDNVITQVNLEEKLARNPENFKKAKTFVMIQCVGSRNDKHPYCSRVCCMHAIKNALKLKTINPEYNIYILHRDIRTYGFLEKYYLKARENGVVFLRYDQDAQPDVKVINNKINVTHLDNLLKEKIDFQADFLVLSTGIVPLDNEQIAKTLKVPVNTDGFFLEAHSKIRPVDFTTEGMFMCGLAHSPRFLHESLVQAQAASMRAVTILSKDKIESKAITACVNERLCRGCGLCVIACPYEARKIDEETNVATVIEALCQGCGACAVACPSGATTHKGFSKRQIMAMVEQGI